MADTIEPRRRADRLDIIFGYAGTFDLVFSVEMLDSPGGRPTISLSPISKMNRRRPATRVPRRSWLAMNRTMISYG